MQPDEIQQRTAELEQRVADLAVAMPRQVEGSDPTGSVFIVLDHTGTPTEIRVQDGWQLRLKPELLADAVLDANADAVRSAMLTLLTAMSGAGGRRPRTTVSRADPSLGHARDDSELVEDVLHRLQDAQKLPASSTSTTGRDDGKHVTVQLAADGLTACVIEPHWAERHDGVALSVALSTALRRAIVTRPVLPSAGLRPDTLIDDALATLALLTATTSVQGGGG